MGIGSYRHLVTLAHPAVVIDPPTWYCAVQPAATQVMDGLAAFFIRGRFHPGIGLETQIQFEGRTFQVQSVTDLDERHTEIQVMAVEVVGRGTTPSGTPVNVPPSIVEGPESTTIDAGDVVLLTVIAAGAAPLSYQWTQDGADLPGEVYQFLETGPIAVTTSFAVRVSNVYGAVTSAPAVVTVPSTYQAQVLADGASAYWPLDDLSGAVARNMASPNPGTISGGVTLNQPGVTADSQSMTFNGTTGKIETAGTVTLPAVATVEAWLKTTDTVGHLDVVSNRFAAANTSFFVNGGVAYVWTTSGVAGIQPIANGVWHHVVWIVDGATATMYVDGGLDSTGAHVRATQTDRVALAYDSLSAGGFFPGSLQDVAIYPRALSAAEIAAHYALRVP